MIRPAFFVPALLAGILSAVACQAGPPDATQIPADAKWIAHIDVDAAKQSKVISAGMKDCLKPVLQEMSREFSQRTPWASLGIGDIRSVTLFGSKIAMNNGGAIVHGTFNEQQLVEHIGQKTDLKTSQYRGRDVYTCTKAAGTQFEHQMAFGFADGNTLVVASGLDGLKQSLDRLEGQGQSLADTNSRLAETAPGNFLLVRAMNLNDNDIGENFAIFKLVTDFEYVAGERNGEYSEFTRILADDADVARSIHQFFQGVIASYKLTFHDNAVVTRWLNDTNFLLQGNALDVRYRASADQVVADMPEACEAIREHMKWHAKMLKWHIQSQEQQQAGSEVRLRPNYQDQREPNEPPQPRPRDQAQPNEPPEPQPRNEAQAEDRSQSDEPPQPRDRGQAQPQDQDVPEPTLEPQDDAPIEELTPPEPQNAPE